MISVSLMHSITIIWGSEQMIEKRQNLYTSSVWESEVEGDIVALATRGVVRC